jgi:hypothetical protein
MVQGVSMATPNLRRHLRCENDTAVTISFLNQSAEYEGIARNYSEGGMYIESDKLLRPGTLVQIRPVSCEAPAGPGTSRPFYCAEEGPEKAECRQLKMMVVGEVKRCDSLGTAESPRYGLAVAYVSPAV